MAGSCSPSGAAAARRSGFAAWSRPLPRIAELPHPEYFVWFQDAFESLVHSIYTSSHSVLWIFGADFMILDWILLVSYTAND